MNANHLLNEMILQVQGFFFSVAHSLFLLFVQKELQPPSTCLMPMVVRHKKEEVLALYLAEGRRQRGDCVQVQ